MKKLSLLTAFVASVTLFSSCLKGEDPEPVAAGGMTFINSFIEAQGLYYLIDRNPISNVYPLAYGEPGYVNFYARPDRRFEVYSSYEDARLVDTLITVVDSVYYSSFLFGTHDDPRHFITEDRIPEGTDDPAAIAAVRFFNLANTPKRATLRIGDAEPLPAFTNRPLETPATGKAGEAFVPVATGEFTISVVDENGETIAARPGTVQLVPGTYTSIFLMGDERDESTFYVGVYRNWVN